jgi:cytochrome c-type biogenesis protein CcmH
MLRNVTSVLVVLALLGLVSSPSRAQKAFAETGPRNAGDTLLAVSHEQVHKIARQLMAPCCWSETADVHQSPAAEEVKAQIRSALQQGYTEQQILEGFVAAYGERILAKPRAVGFNLLVWILPAVAIVFGSLVAWRYLRRSSQPKTLTKPAKPVARDDPYGQQLERELEAFDQ